MTKARIIVADDHPIIRSGVRRYIEGAPSPTFEIVGEFADADAVRTWLGSGGRADAGIIDVQMPAMGSGELIAELASAGCRAVLFTLRPPDDPLVKSCAAFGAAGYVHKTAPIEALLESVARVAAGDEQLPDGLRPSRPVEPPHLELTAREYQVFVLLARCLTPKEAAFEMNVSLSTLYTHANRVRTKLGVSTFSELVAYAEAWAIDLNAPNRT